MVVMDIPRSSEGKDSGNRTLVTISQPVAPIVLAASTTPWSTSSKEVSTILATNGVAAITSGTTEAVAPIALPTIALVTGTKSIIRMINGIERPMSIAQPSAVLSFGCGQIPCFPVATTRTPSGSPSR